MSAEQREEAVFEAALQLPADQRSAYLDTECAGDAELRRRVEVLLGAFGRASGFMKQPAADTSGRTRLFSHPPSEKPGDCIGRYKLLQQIGEGGCGVVYMAEQTEPVHRRVALKVIKLGMDTRQVITRFEAERQALALMDHPNIAKVLDGGSTENGRPYFVMELVRGIKITDYCDQNNLSTRDRLDLFIQVCQAIQHAHQKGIIHRDIKPSNILVTVNDGVAVPKVIDFGIAKATQGRLTDKTLFTAFEQFIGTPAYMSPEQAVMTSLDIDTRSDIYSLGVLLYELLTSKTPFDANALLQAGLDAMRRTILEVEPPRPSARLSTMLDAERATTASQRQTEPPRLIHLLKGDLDWIVMKCLEKERGRRYETATGLAADIKRHLNTEPVEARPPSKLYEFQKTVRRHKFGFAAAAALFTVLAAGVLISAREARRALQSEAMAKERLAESQAVSKLMMGVFQSPDPERDGRTITVAETLDRAVTNLDRDLAAQPALRAQLQATLGRTYDALGLYHEAIPLEEKVRDYYLKNLGIENTNTLKAMDNLATSYWEAGRNDKALKLREQMLALYRKVLGPEHPNTLWAMGNLANSYYTAGRRDEALKLREQVLALRRKVLGPEHPETISAMNNLAISYNNAGRKNEALKLREQVLAFFRKVLGPEHPITLRAMNNLAVSYDNAGRNDEALKLKEQVLALRRKALGPEHPDTIMAMNNLANSYDAAGRKDEAFKLREQVLALRRKVLGPEHPDTIMAMGNLASSYDEAGRKDEALKLREQVLALSRKVSGPEHPDTLTAVNNLVDAYIAAGRKDEALKLREDALAIANKRDPNSWPSITAHAQVGFTLIALGRGDEAIKTWQEEVHVNPTDTQTAKLLATVYLWLGQTNEHQAICRKLLDLAAYSKDPLVLDGAAKAYLLQAHPDPELLKPAVASGRQALKLSTPDDANRGWFLITAAMAAVRDEKPAEAEPLLTEALNFPSDTPDRQDLALAYRAMARAQLGRTNEARADFAALEKLVLPLPAQKQLSPALLSDNHMAACIAYEEARALIEGQTDAPATNANRQSN